MVDNDIIEMKLDMYKLDLSLKVDVYDDFIHVLNVEDCEYRAVVTLNCIGDGLGLLSYQRIH